MTASCQWPEIGKEVHQSCQEEKHDFETEGMLIKYASIQE